MIWHELALELLDESVHVLALNEPPTPPSLQDTVPEGEDDERSVSLTIAANLIWPPLVTEAGFGDMVVVME